MLDKIIKCCSDNLFINIDDVKVKFYLDKLSIYDRNMLLRQIYDYNNKKYKELENQNKEYLKNLNSTNIIMKSTTNKIKQVREKLYQEETKVVNQELKIDISFYMQVINNIKNLAELEEILPDKSNTNYVDIINSILIKLVEEMVIIKKIIKETDKEDSDIIYYNSELKKCLDKIDYIKNYDFKINLSKEVIKRKDNKVIFLTTNANNNCFMNDLLKNVDEHYYEYVKQLLYSIKNASFKNVKTFANVSGLYEMKVSSLRIIFRRLKPGIYIILQVLVKKFQNQSHYQSSIIARNNLYKNNEKEILVKLNDQSYLDYNEQIYKDIINYLDMNKRGINSEKINRKNK